MLALEPNRKLRRRQLRFRGIGPDAVGLPFGSRPEAWIYYGTLHWADTDLMQAEIVSAANHDLPLPEFDLSARGEGKWPVVSGEWLVLHARYAAQSNRVKPVKPVKPGQTQSNPVKPSQTQSNPVKPSQTNQTQSNQSNRIKPVKPNQTESNRIKPYQTWSNQVEPGQTIRDQGLAGVRTN
jgi:hypothetical protein